MKNSRVVILIIFLAAVAYFLIAGASPKLAQKPPQIQDDIGYSRPIVKPPTPAVAVCKNGETKPCASTNRCEGETECINGQWASCVVQRICRPGRVAPCPLDSCNFGTRTCNECGSGWSECR